MQSPVHSFLLAFGLLFMVLATVLLGNADSIDPGLSILVPVAFGVVGLCLFALGLWMPPVDLRRHAASMDGGAEMGDLDSSPDADLHHND